MPHLDVNFNDEEIGICSQIMFLDAIKFSFEPYLLRLHPLFYKS